MHLCGWSLVKLAKKKKKSTVFQLRFYIQSCLHNFCIWKGSFIFQGKMVLVRKNSLPNNKLLLYSPFLV